MPGTEQHLLLVPAGRKAFLHPAGRSGAFSCLHHLNNPSNYSSLRCWSVPREGSGAAEGCSAWRYTDIDIYFCGIRDQICFFFSSINPTASLKDRQLCQILLDGISNIPGEQPELILTTFWGLIPTTNCIFNAFGLKAFLVAQWQTQ